jgi:hypothetical protein
MTIHHRTINIKYTNTITHTEQEPRDMSYRSE